MTLAMATTAFAGVGQGTAGIQFMTGFDAGPAEGVHCPVAGVVAGTGSLNTAPNALAPTTIADIIASPLSSIGIHFGQHPMSLNPVNLDTWTLFGGGTPPTGLIHLGGIVVVAHGNRHVQVNIEHFQIGGTNTMLGFTMNLTPRGTPFVVGAATMTAQATPTAISQPGGPVQVATVSMGITGHNYSASISIPAGASQVGAATAQMTWTLVNAP